MKKKNPTLPKHRSALPLLARMRSAGPMQDKYLKRSSENKNPDYLKEYEMADLKSTVLFSDCSIASNKYQAEWRGFTVTVFKLDSPPDLVFIIIDPEIHPDLQWVKSNTIKSRSFFVEKDEINQNLIFENIKD